MLNFLVNNIKERKFPLEQFYSNTKINVTELNQMDEYLLFTFI